MKNLFVVNFAENTIIATKTTLKQASVPNSPEYKALMKLMKQNPNFTVEVKEIKKAEGKETYEGLTKEFIKAYIAIQQNADVLNKELEKVADMGKFPLVRKWFLNKFENFNMAKAKEEIEKAMFEKIASSVAESQSNTPAGLKAVANF